MLIGSITIAVTRVTNNNAITLPKFRPGHARLSSSKPMTTTTILLRFSRDDKSILVNPIIGAQVGPPYHAVLIVQNR
jgi:hypothetical protein